MVTAPPLTDVHRTKRKSHPAPGLTNDTEWPPVSLPSDFEMHMAHDLLLKRVVHCPGLAKALADIAAERLDPLSEHVAALPHDTFSGHKPSAYAAAVNIATSVKTPADIHNAYAKFESLVARIVGALYHPTKNILLQSFLLWKSREMHGLCRAVGDGYAYIHPGLPGVPQSEAKELRNVIHQNLSPFVVLSVHPVGDPYKAPGLSSDQDDLFDAIQTLPDEGRFHWRSCGTRYGCGSDFCTHRGVQSVAGRRTGLDSDILKDVLATAENVMPAQSMAVEADPTITRTSHPLRKKAERSIQSVWSKGVASDATFIFMSTGNRDLIAMRDRENQTLYLSQTMTHQSQVISPYAVHAGAMYSAVKDVIARANMIQRRRDTGSIMPDRFTRTYHIDALKGPLLPSTEYIEDDELRQVSDFYLPFPVCMRC
ncbi:hypothetical protein BDZ89DRAFT_258861 [Hymenopellis radicata]|nr:hypothetical protein BDZ89DRAFT_258861 [Hymenopellis radicata]